MPGALSILWFLLCGSFVAAAGEGSELRLQVPVEQTIRAGESLSYRLVVGPGRMLRVTAEQRDIDLLVAVLDAGGSTLARVDAVDETRGRELVLVPVEPGQQITVTVQARARGPAAGGFRLLAEQPAAIAELAAEQLMTEAAALQLGGSAESLEQAETTYRQALGAWQRAGDSWWQARAWHALATIEYRRRRYPAARRCFEQALELWRGAGDRFGAALALEYLGFLEGRIPDGDPAHAVACYRQALAEYRAIGDARGEAKVLINLATAHMHRSETRPALALLEQARQAIRSLDDNELAVSVLNSLAGHHQTLGEHRQARELLVEALRLSRAIRNRDKEVVTLSNLGVTCRNLGDYQQALEYQLAARSLSQELGDHKRQATALNNIGMLYADLGQPELALGFFEQALPLRREIGDRRGEDTTLHNMGLVQARLGRHELALDLLFQALEMEKERQDHGDLATTLTSIAAVYSGMGRHEEALGVLTQALEKRRQLGGPGRLAAILCLLGQGHLGLGHPDRAIPLLDEALQLSRESADQEQQLSTLCTLAKAYRAEGELQQSLALLSTAQDLLESRRFSIPNPELRASYLAERQSPYELAVLVRMELHGRQPDAGHDRIALGLNERRRARALLDLLNEAGITLRRGVDSELWQRRSALTEDLRGLALAQRSLRAGSDRAEQQQLEARLEVVLAELDLVESSIRQQSPVYAELTRPAPVSAEQIMAMLDDDTLLIEYSLGDERSHAWVVTSQGLSAFELAPRAEIEEAARALHQAWSVPRATPGEDGAAAATRLRELVLGPLASRLDGQHSTLVVVADGALHCLPFAALPLPDAPTQPLLARYQLSQLPSASALLLQRRRLAGRTPPPHLLAVIADPVFSADDPRLEGRQQTMVSSLLRDRPVRLPGSRLEAEAVLALVPAEQRMQALGTAATREVVLSGRLGAYSYLHFATHGELHSEHPSLSGLVLSLVDETGKARDGWLRLHDLYGLDLQAELVVLSGCRTALGQELRGEGFVGLTRGFLSSGARRVVASLWQVQDRVTAELMTHFYRSMLDGGASPAAALRQAQLALRRDRRWRDPYYWAAFVLVGEWQ